jgi:hypothetical protein
MLGRKKILFLILILLFGIPFFITLFIQGNTAQNKKEKIKVLKITPSIIFPTSILQATPIPITFQPKVYKDTMSVYSLPYPSLWNVNAYNRTDGVHIVSFSFVENDKEYLFNILPQASIVPESYTDNPSSIQTKDIFVGKKQFTETIIYREKTPFFIMASSKDDSELSTFSLKLPPTNTQNYIDIFNQMITNLTFLQ